MSRQSPSHIGAPPQSYATMGSRPRMGGKFTPGLHAQSQQQQVDDGEVGIDPTWAKKPHRQRRFTQTARPELHEAEQEALYEAQNWTREDVEIEGLSQELEQKLFDMDEGVRSYVAQKEREEYLKSRFDEDGKPIKMFDAEGNELPFDEDEYYEYEAMFGYPPGGSNAISRSSAAALAPLDSAARRPSPFPK